MYWCTDHTWRDERNAITLWPNYQTSPKWRALGSIASARFIQLSWSATLSNPACTHGSSTPGEPDAPTPPTTSSPTLIGRPPGMAMMFGSVTCCRTTGLLSAKRLAYSAVGMRKFAAVYALRRAFSIVYGCALSPRIATMVSPSRSTTTADSAYPLAAQLSTA